MNAEVIKLEKVRVRIGGYKILEAIDWEITTGEQWAIIGPNGAGKSTLAKAIIGKVPVVEGSINQIHDSQVGYVSFELHDFIMEEEEQQEKSRDFSGEIHEKTPVRYVISRSKKLSSADKSVFNSVVKLVNILSLLGKKLNHLSNGELRKVLIARALMKKPKLLILDEPFDGLDGTSSLLMRKIIDKLTANKLKVIFVTHRFNEIPSSITHILVLNNGRVIMKGRKAVVLKRLLSENVFFNNTDKLTQNHLQTNSRNTNQLPQVLVDMKNITVAYGSKIILDGISWQMKKGEHWLIIGNNGAGKSTFLKLITGDTLQSYANNITLFGIKKGNGETVWDIKKYLSLVSSEEHLQFPKNIEVLDVILSGFFDAKSVIQPPDLKQIQTAKKWIKILGLQILIHKKLKELSTGQQRLVLLARALVKNPYLLILDEPCQGLDVVNKKHILSIINKISSHTQLLYVTHHQDEIPSKINRIAKLEKGKLIIF